MITFWVIFSLAICLGQTKPADFGELEYDNIPHDSLEKDDSIERDDSQETDDSVKSSYGGNVYETGVFTKYPENPTEDGYYEAPNSRQRRNTSDHRSVGEHDALDVNQLFFDKVYNASRPERNSEEKTSKVPLRGLISAIEAELVDSAEKINLEVSNREQRSAETTTTQTGTEKPDSGDDDSIDVNKNFFDEIFEFTRAQRHATDENPSNKTIRLQGLVQAVESTLVKSAQKLQTAATKKSSAEIGDKTAVDTETKERKTRSADHDEDDDDDDDDSKEEVDGKSHIGVEKVLPNKNINLDLLKPIAFKTPASESSESHESSESDEVSSTTPAVQVQPTHLIVVHESNSTHIIPNADNKTVHVQQQQISQSIFQSTLAIWPTIPSSSINVPAVTTASTTAQTTQTDVVDAVTDTVDSSTQKQLDENKVSDETQKLKEKVAEVAATPIILSQGI